KILVVERIASVAHEVATPLLKDVDAVLTGTEQRVQLEVAPVVMAHRVVEEQAGFPDQPELAEIAPVARVTRRVPRLLAIDALPFPGTPGRQVEDRLVEGDRRQRIDIEVLSEKIAVL